MKQPKTPKLPVLESTSSRRPVSSFNNFSMRFSNSPRYLTDSAEISKNVRRAKSFDKWDD